MKSLFASTNHHFKHHPHQIWLIPLAILLLQIFLTQNSLHQLRIEEIAESIRNPYWFTNHTNYDTASIHVGWYQIIHWAQLLLGFNLYQGKVIKIIPLAIFLITTTLALKKHFKPTYTILILTTFGLSPIFLYFNTFAAQFGIDLITIPICLFILKQLSFKKPSTKNTIYHLLFWVTLGILPLIYITHIFYYPGLLLLYYHKYNNSPKKPAKYLRYTLGFTIPLLIIYFTNQSWSFIHNFINPFLNNSAYSQTTHQDRITNITHVFKDIFISGDSYHYELPLPDFSFLFPALAILTAILIIIRSKKSKPIQIILISLTFTALFNFIVINLFQPINRSPGIRRNTPLLLSIYGLIILASYIVQSKPLKHQLPFIISLLILTTHHLLVIPTNLNHLRSKSIYSYFDQIADPNQSPKDYIDELTQALTTKSIQISCQGMSGERDFCRYQETFSAVASQCRYQNLNCHPLYGHDPKTSTYLPITQEIYDSNYWDKHSYTQTGF